MVELIQKYFKPINKRSAVPVYRQLEDQARIYAREQPGNTLFPSERELAEHLKLNRRTIRKAIQPLIRDNSLYSTQKGTFVRKSTRDFPLDSINPLNFAMFAPPVQKKTLRVLIYENMPDQIRFWQEITDRFNSADYNSELHIEQMDFQGNPPSSLFMGRAAFCKELSKADADIVQLPVTRIWTDEVPALFAPLPKETASLFDQKGYLAKHFCRTFPEMLNCAFPFAAGCRALCCNMDLLYSLGHNELPEDPFVWAHLQYPDGKFLIEHICNISENNGFMYAYSQKLCKEYYQELVRIFRESDFPRLFIQPPWSAGTFSLKSFMEGKTLLAPTICGCLWNYLREHVGFEYKMILHKPLPGRFMQANCNLFAVTKQCMDTDAAHEFFAFLYSPEIQDLLAKYSMVPMREASLGIFAHSLEVPEKEIKKYLRKAAELPYKLLGNSRNALLYHAIAENPASDQSEIISQLCKESK